MNEIDALVAIVALVLIAAVVLFLLSPHYIRFGSLPGVSTVPILLIDPPQIPAGTQAVFVSYSSLAVESNGAWSNATGGGTINLLKLTNSSRIIGYVTMATNAPVSAFRIHINYVKIKVNKIIYNVSVPNPNITMTFGSNSVIAPKSGILMYLLSAVAENVTVYSGAGDPANYTMRQYAKGILIGGMDNITNTFIGNTLKINASTKAALRFSA